VAWLHARIGPIWRRRSGVGAEVAALTVALNAESYEGDGGLLSHRQVPPLLAPVQQHKRENPDLDQRPVRVLSAVLR
jgi:hypothetical protein